MVGGLVSGLVVAVVVVFIGLLRAGAQRPAKRDANTGDLVLQCGPVLAWVMGTIAVGGPLCMGLLSLVIPFEHRTQVFVPLALGAFFLLLGGMMCLWALKRRTRLGERGLTSEYVFSGPRFLPWNEVKKIDFASGQELWIRGAAGQKAMLHLWFIGSKEAVPLLRAHLPEEVQQKYKAVLERFAGTVGA